MTRAKSDWRQSPKLWRRHNERHHNRNLGRARLYDDMRRASVLMGRHTITAFGRALAMRDNLPETIAAFLILLLPCLALVLFWVAY